MNRRERRTQWQASHRLGTSAGRDARGLSPAAPAFSSVRMQIGALVLRGFEKRHGSRIAAAFERSLEQHLREGVLPASSQRTMRSSSLRLMPLTVRRGADSEAIGEALAGAVVALEREQRRQGSSR